MVIGVRQRRYNLFAGHDLDSAHIVVCTRRRVVSVSRNLATGTVSEQSIGGLGDRPPSTLIKF